MNDTSPILTCSPIRTQSIALQDASDIWLPVDYRETGSGLDASCTSLLSMGLLLADWKFFSSCCSYQCNFPALLQNENVFFWSCHSTKKDTAVWLDYSFALNNIENTLTLLSHELLYCNWRSSSTPYTEARLNVTNVNKLFKFMLHPFLPK